MLCSGQIGTGADGKVPADLTEEFTNAWTKVGNVLKAAGVDFSDVLEYTTYHVGLQSTMGTFMKVRDQVPEGTVAGVDRHRHHGTRGARRARGNTGDRSQAQVTESFWRDPPWRGGKAGYRMGLRPIESSTWLPDRINAEELARKQRLLDDAASGVFAELADSRAGQQKILDAVNDGARQRAHLDERRAHR